MASEVAKAYALANEIIGLLEDYIRIEKGKSIHLHFKKDQQLKLLKLNLLSIRYKLSIPEILVILIPLIRDRMMHNRSTFGLGININVLCGQAAERMLFEELKKNDPGDERIELWKAKARDRQLEVEAAIDDDGVHDRVYNTPLDAPSVASFINSYRQRVLSRRAADEAARADKSRRRKVYRNNPWL